MKILSAFLYGYLYSDTLTGDQVTYQLYTAHSVMLHTVYTLLLHGEHSVTTVYSVHIVTINIIILYTVSLNSHYCYYTVLTVPPYSVYTVSFTIIL